MKVAECCTSGKEARRKASIGTCTYRVKIMRHSDLDLHRCEEPVKALT